MEAKHLKNYYFHIYIEYLENSERLKKQNETPFKLHPPLNHYEQFHM